MTALASPLSRDLPGLRFHLVVLLHKETSMKAKSIVILLASIAIIGISPDRGWSQLFGSDEDKWERVMMEMKKINSRLVSLKTTDLKNLEDSQNTLKQTQGEILAQIQGLQSIIPNIQGVVEQGNSDVNKHVSGFSAKLAELELSLRDELGGNNKTQTAAIDGLRADVNSKVDEMKTLVDAIKVQVDALKLDMGNNVNTLRTETIARLGELKEAMATDREKIQGGMAGDVDRIDKNVTGGMDVINRNLVSAVDTITKSNKALLEEFTAKKSDMPDQVDAIKKHEQNVLLRLTEIDAGTQKMIDILSENLAEGKAVKGGVESLNGKLLATNENININREAISKLKAIFDAQLADLKKGQVDLYTQNENSIKNSEVLNQNLLVAEGKINKVAETLQAFHLQNLSSAQGNATLQERFNQVITAINQTDEKFNQLIDATKQYAVNSAQINKKLDDMMLKVEASQASSGGLTDEKVGNLITILRSIADEQGKIAHTVTAQEGNLLNALGVHETNVNKALSVHDGNMNQVMKAHESNVAQAGGSSEVIEALNAHEHNVIKALNAHEENTSKALGAYEENITQALKVYAQALTVYEENMIQAWNVHDKNSSNALTDLNANSQKVGAVQSEIKNSINELRNKANVNISRNEDILKSLKRLVPQ